MHFELNLPQRQIARGIQLSQSTVNEYLNRFQRSGLVWPLAEGYDNRRLQERLFAAADKPDPPVSQRPLPDYAQIHHELTTNRHTCLQLLGEEYREAHPNAPYSYTSFWRHYDRWRTRQDLVMRQQHLAGVRLFVDWAGAKIPIYDPQSGEARPASLFVAVMGASSYTYAEATASQELEHWIGAHVRTFKFLGGVPELIVPDNAKTGVLKACRYEPDLNPTYQEMAVHYGVGVAPARPRKPRDKAKVEVGVQIAQRLRWILAALRQFDHSFYSVPYTLARQNVEVRSTPATVEIFRQGNRVASHVRARKPYTAVTQNEHPHEFAPIAMAGGRKPYTAVTQNEHRPKAHQAHLQWPPSRLVSWALTVGPFTSRLFGLYFSPSRSKPRHDRYPILFWRLGAVAFFGTGEVAKTFGDFSFSNLIAGGGVGLRFVLAKKNHINLRAGYGWGKDSREFYVSVGEAF